MTVRDELARIAARRERAAARWARVSAGALVAAAAVALAGLQPAPVAPTVPVALPFGPLPPDPLEACRVIAQHYARSPGAHVACMLDGTEYAGLPIPTSWTDAPFGLLGPGNMPTVTAMATGGRPGCVTGPDRPVLRTTTPTLSATFTLSSLVPVEAHVEYQSLDGADHIVSSGHEVLVDRPVTTTLGPGELAPGTSYRWRIRATPEDAAMPGWSPWCEFATAADAPDLRGLDDDDIDALRALRLDPGRRYAVRLRAADWARVIGVLGTPGTEPTVVVGPDGSVVEWVEGEWSREDDIAAAVRQQIGDAASRRARVTLTGDRWATIANALAWSASEADMPAEEEPEPGFPGGAADRAVLSRVSVQLGGPARPDLPATR